MQPQDDNSSLPPPLAPPVASEQDDSADTPVQDPPIPQNLQQADYDQPEPTATQHLGADDLDLIEKEWVLKAKEVVDNTQNDPYLQSKELSKIRADYIKKRYNRTIKPNE